MSLRIPPRRCADGRVRFDDEELSDEEYWARNGFQASPCFIRVIERQFGKKERQFSLEELGRLKAIWDDGFSLGEYCEATKDAEGT
jgi:hypothetical protein